MESARKWSQLFNNWPEGLARKGLITTLTTELIPFKSFMLADELLVLERTTPDPSGTRFIVLGYESIESVKLIDAVKEAPFQSLGFVGNFSNR